MINKNNFIVNIHWKALSKSLYSKLIEATLKSLRVLNTKEKKSNKYQSLGKPGMNYLSISLFMKSSFG